MIHVVFRTQSRRYFIALSILYLICLAPPTDAEVLRYHDLALDNEDKILPWYTPNEHAYDHYLKQLWTWLPTVPNGPGSSLPMYYLYCGFKPGNPITPDNWENDWGERLPNFIEFARLYYAYTGDTQPLEISRALADYALAHGMTPANYAWPSFPYGTANAGATEIRGDNVAWDENDILIDLGSDMGAAFYKLFLLYGTPAYRDAAIGIADTLASKIQTGDAEHSPWPYVVNAASGAVVSRYTSNFAGALTLFDLLIEHEEPSAAAYESARKTLKTWILTYPMRNGNWVDGHSDVRINGTDNWSNTAKSNMALYLLDHPDFDRDLGDWGGTFDLTTDLNALLRWTEDNFVDTRTDDGLPGQYHGASVPAEQFAYMMRTGYQTSRLAAEYAAYYELTGDENAKDKAFRGFNYSTYMMKDSGESSDGPTDAVGFWWGDVYAEGPRMFFYGFRAVPEWAPPGESHILYSRATLTDVQYSDNSVEYATKDDVGAEYLRLAFLPTQVTVNGNALPKVTEVGSRGYVLSEIANGDYAVTLTRGEAGTVVISGAEPPPGSSPPTIAVPATAVPNPAVGKTSALSVLGDDDGGEGNLTYTWATSGAPPAAVSFSVNGTNAAKDTVVTFSKSGDYALQVTVTDSDGLTAISGVHVTVTQVPTGLAVTPPEVSLTVNATQPFSANVTDQFGDDISAQPTVAWTVTGGGTIDPSGLFAAGATPGGPYIVTATSGTQSAQASVTIIGGDAGGTLGYTSIGSSRDPSGANDINCWRFRADSTFTATAMQINLARPLQGRIKLAIYADNGGLPGALLAQSNEITNPSSGWAAFSLTTPQVIENGTAYWLAAWSDRPYEPSAERVGGTARYLVRSYGDWPSALTGTRGPYSTLDSIYAYSEGGSPPVNTPPTVVTPATASPSRVTDRTASLSVLGDDDDGEGNLTYTWRATGSAPAAVSFSASGTNAAKNSVATFGAAGDYALEVTITDREGLTAVSSVSVTVAQTLTGIAVTPAVAEVVVATSQRFVAIATDQFGDTMEAPPAIDWAVSGGGTVDSTGLFTAGAVAGGPYELTASSSAVTGSASLTIVGAGGTAILGNPDVGEGTDPSGANDINCWRFQAQNGFLASRMQINLAQPLRGRMKLAIYADDNGSPGALLASSSERTNPGSGWNTFPLEQDLAISAGTHYWLAAWADGWYVPRARPSGGTARYVRRTYGTWPSPLTGTLGPYPTLESIFAD